MYVTVCVRKNTLLAQLCPSCSLLCPFPSTEVVIIKRKQFAYLAIFKFFPNFNTKKQTIYGKNVNVECLLTHEILLVL